MNKQSKHKVLTLCYTGNTIHVPENEDDYKEWYTNSTQRSTTQ